MNNKKGGFGAKLLLVLILMIASAVGGAYGYRVLDGKLAVRDAMEAVEDVDISDYDDAEKTVIQGYIDDAKKDLETAKTRKEVYEILGKFLTNVDKVQTSNEKKLEEALKAAEEAKNYNSGSSDTSTGNSTYDSSTDTSSGSSSGNYKSNELSSGSEEEEKSDGGILNSLFGSMNSSSN